MKTTKVQVIVFAKDCQLAGCVPAVFWGMFVVKKMCRDGELKMRNSKRMIQAV